jgi:tetratricopeptide (TPR) repeat protein
MPTHIDVQCGHYNDVVKSNDLAIAADLMFARREDALDSFQALSRAHNLHFKLYGAMLLGHYGAAAEAGESLRTSFSEALLRTESPPMADWLEGYVAMAVHPLIRFGHWEQLAAVELPRDTELYCTTVAMTHYGKGLACAVLGRLSEAESQTRAFHDAVKRVPQSRRVFNNTCLDILGIAAEMLHGEIEYRAARYDHAFDHLRTAVARSDALPYDEPWGWMQPARHALGALLLEQDQVEEAEAVYRQDLGLDPSVHRPCRHPDNVWALHGFHEALRRQSKHAEADLVELRLTLARARADVDIRASCLCRLSRHRAA